MSFKVPEVEKFYKLPDSRAVVEFRINTGFTASCLKKLHATDRPMTTPLFLLRCVQLGISIRDLDLLTIGMVNDMYAESSNDEYKGYAQIATQMDFDSF